MNLASLIRRLSILFGVLALLLVAWHAEHGIFDSWFLWFANKALLIVKPGGEARLSEHALQGGIESLSFIIGYLPLAVFLSFALATPLPRKQLGRLLVRGLVLMHVLLVFRIYLFSAVQFIRGHTEVCPDPGHRPWWHGEHLFYDILNYATTAFDEMDIYQVPTVLLWLALTWNVADWNSIFPKEKNTTSTLGDASHPA